MATVRASGACAAGTHERGLLSNARCLGEGVDVPTLDGVAFIDPRRSEVDIIQAVGRAIRKAEDKTMGRLSSPCSLETRRREAAIETSAFNPVWQVLRALRAHDGTLADEIDEMRRSLGRLAPKSVSKGHPEGVRRGVCGSPISCLP